MKRFLITLGALAACWAPGLGADTLTSLFQDPVLARGTGVEIKRSQLDDSFIAYKANLAGRGASVPEPERTAREALLLDRLIVTQLLVQRATEADRTTARTNAERIILETMKEMTSPETFRRRLKALGLSGERYTNQVMDQTLAQAVVDRELRSKITVEDARVSEFYNTGTDVLVTALQSELERMAKDPESKPDRIADVKKQIEAVKKNNLNRLEQPERVKVSHVMMSTRDRVTEEPLTDDQKKVKRSQIDRLRVAAKGGEDFQKLVMDFSEDRSLKENKGEYVLTRETQFVPEFKVAAFNLQAGEISEVVTTPFGYHIIKCLDRFPAKKVDLDEKVKRDIKELLTEQDLQKLMGDFFRRLKKDAGVEVLEAKYRVDSNKDTNPLKPDEK
jgi:parvulin-like peptidyl-prolyl isomerase